VLLHQLQELDHHLAGGADQHLLLWGRIRSVCGREREGPREAAAAAAGKVGVGQTRRQLTHEAK
jgi:hypothetical protein